MANGSVSVGRGTRGTTGSSPSGPVGGLTAPLPAAADSPGPLVPTAFPLAPGEPGAGVIVAVSQPNASTETTTSRKARRRLPRLASPRSVECVFNVAHPFLLAPLGGSGWEPAWQRTSSSRANFRVQTGFELGYIRGM